MTEKTPPLTPTQAYRQLKLLIKRKLKPHHPGERTPLNQHYLIDSQFHRLKPVARHNQKPTREGTPELTEKCHE